MQVNENEYISLLKIKGIIKAVIRVYRDTPTDPKHGGLGYLFDRLDEEIKHHETFHNMGTDGTGEAAQ